MKTKIVQKSYKFRIYPTLEQIIFFSKTFGCVRKVYNLMLDDRKKDYEKYKLTGIKTKYPTPAKYKEEYPYLKLPIIKVLFILIKDILNYLNLNH